MNVKFNVNETVRVRLTERGRKVLEEEHHALYDRFPLGNRREYIPVTEDEDGWSEWQLWILMSHFGVHTGLGFDPCFETEIEFVVENG